MPQAVLGPCPELLQDVHTAQMLYSHLCCKALRADATHSFMGMPAASPTAYLSGLQSGAAIQRMSVTASTQTCRDKAMSEFSAWLQTSGPNRGLYNCIPEDILVYLVNWWAQEHGGCKAPDGSRFAAPVSLEALCSHLAVEFDKMGRTGEWDPSNLTGRL